MNVSVALGSFAASWLTFLCLPSAWSALDRSRVPSILHSFVASYIALSLVPTYWSAVTGPQAAPLWRPGSAYENAFLSGVVGFFSMDLTLGLFFKGVMQPAFVAHHLTVIGSILLGFASAGTPVNCMMMLHEISVPFTNLHGVLTPSSPLRAPNGVLMATTFFFGRLLVCALLARVVASAPDIGEVFATVPGTLIMQVCMLGVMAVLDVYWFYLICKGIAKALGFGATKKSAD